jgi:vacuolar-type H+-ATPase subunit E/Vma4
MSIKEITARIAADARDQVSLIEESAARDAARRIKEAEIEAARKVEAGAVEGVKIAERERRQAAAAAKLAGRDQTLSAKRELLDDVVAGARERFKTMGDKDYENLLAGLIAAHAAGWQEIVFDPGVPAAVKAEIIEKANVRIKEIGGQPVKESKESREIGPGFILKSGRIEENRSFETLLSAAAETLEADMVSLLFGS